MLIRIRKKGNIIYLYCDKIYDRFMSIVMERDSQTGSCMVWIFII